MKSLSRMYLLIVVLFVLAVCSLVVARSVPPQAAGSPAGKIINLDGQVSVNGTSAISGATVFSDSTITTAARSSAVVSLGKLGRVEVLPDTTMKLTSADKRVEVSMLESGRVRVSSSSNIDATVVTRDGRIVSTGNVRNEFLVDTSCGNTLVSVKKGQVMLRAGDTVKQIAAGNQDTAGQVRPGCTPAP